MTWSTPVEANPYLQVCKRDSMSGMRLHLWRAARLEVVLSVMERHVER